MIHDDEDLIDVEPVVRHCSKPLHKNRFNILFENVWSLKASGRLDDVKCQLAEAQKEGIIIHVVGICESWLKENIAKDYKIDNYKAAHCVREKGKGGGVAFYIHDSLNFDPEKDILYKKDHKGSNFLVVNIRKYNIKLLQIYRESKTHLNDFYDILEDILSKFNNMIMMGDINLCLMNKESNCYRDIVMANGHCLLNKINSNHATCGKRIIDHFSTDLLQYNFKMNIKLNSFSDHKTIRVSFDRKVINNEMVNLRKTDQMKINSELDCLLSKHSFENFESLAMEMSQIIEKNTKTFKVRQRYIQNKWYSSLVSKEIAERDSIKSRLNKWPNCPILKEKFKKQKNRTTSIVKQACKDYYIKKIDAVKDSPREVFKVFKEILFGQSADNTIPTEIIHNHDKVTNEQEICNIFNAEFINMPIKLNNQLLSRNNDRERNLTMHFSNINSIYVDEASDSDIILAISNLKNNAAPGLDGIGTKLIKKHHEKLIPILKDLINKMLSTGEFPRVLKMSKIRPIFKSGAKNDVNNYRPVALLSSLEKIVENFIHSKTTEFLNSYNIFGKRTFGFRKQSNTTSAIINLLTRVQDALDKGLLCSVIFLDLSKAFDTIDHKILLNKLNKVGIRGTFLELFESYLWGRQQFVQIKEVKSSSMFNGTGLPQGAICSPTLYNIYAKDIDELNLEGYLQTFADDKASLYTAKTAQELFGKMQRDCDTLGGWLYDNSLTANASKTKYLVFSSSKSLKNNNYSLKLNNQEIERVETYKYLGLHLQANLKWNDHVAHISRKISSFMGPMLKCSNVLPPETRLKLYYSYVYPHLTLYNSIWCDHQRTSNYLFKHVQTLQNKFIRTIFKELYYYNNEDSNGNRIIHTADLFMRHKILTLAQINSNELSLITHRILHKSINIDITFPRNYEIHKYPTSNFADIHLFKTKATGQKIAFSLKSAKTFNSLPQLIKDTTNHLKFKKLLKNHILNSGVT